MSKLNIAITLIDYFVILIKWAIKDEKMTLTKGRYFQVTISPLFSESSRRLSYRAVHFFDHQQKDIRDDPA